MKTFKQAFKRLPSCALCASENCMADSGGENIQDLIDGVNHELALYYEGEESINDDEAMECLEYLKWLKS